MIDLTYLSPVGVSGFGSWTLMDFEMVEETLERLDVELRSVLKEERMKT